MDKNIWQFELAGTFVSSLRQDENWFKKKKKKLLFWKLKSNYGYGLC